MIRKKLYLYKRKIPNQQLCKEKAALARVIKSKDITYSTTTKAVYSPAGCIKQAPTVVSLGMKHNGQDNLTCTKPGSFCKSKSFQNSVEHIEEFTYVCISP